MCSLIDCVIVHIWRFEDNLWVSELSVHHEGARDEAQAIRLGDKAPLPAEPSCRP